MAPKGANGVAFNLKGMPELYDALKTLSTRMGRQALERAGLDAAEPTARHIRSITPVDKEGGPNAGELRESIDVGVSAEEFDGGNKVYARTIREGGTKEQAVSALRDYRRGIKGQRGDYYATVFIGPVAGRSKDDVIKGYVQEFGNASTEPQSYLRAGFEQDRPALTARLVKNIQFEVYDAVGKKAARAARKG